MHPHQRVVQFVRRLGIGPSLLAHASDGVRIETPQIGGALGIEPAPADDGLRASLFERRIVEEGIRFGGENLCCERGRFGHVLGDDAYATRLLRGEQSFEPVDIHCNSEAIVEGLRHQRVIRIPRSPAMFSAHAS